MLEAIEMSQILPYRGRLAPSPTGLLHLGHARTFATAQRRARVQGGTLILRSEDLDRSRVRPEFCTAMLEDLRWAGFSWAEGPDVGGPHAPYVQSQRLDRYRTAFHTLLERNLVYPCVCTRKDILSAIAAPHAGEEEPIYPGTCRPQTSERLPDRSPGVGLKQSWRFRVPDGETISFVDGHFGPQSFVAGKDFGDFVIWRNDDFPAYQLAVVTDDAVMGITEVVRGADLLLSTARQILLYRALGFPIPQFYHCPLVLDEKGERLAKRHDALSLRTLRAEGKSPQLEL